MSEVTPSNESGYVVSPSTEVSVSRIKAVTKLILMADDVLVAESDDSYLWGTVLSAIITEKPTLFMPGSVPKDHP